MYSGDEGPKFKCSTDTQRGQARPSSSSTRVALLQLARRNFAEIYSYAAPWPFSSPGLLFRPVQLWRVSMLQNAELIGSKLRHNRWESINCTEWCSRIRNNFRGEIC